VYPAPADGTDSPLLPFHESEDELATDVFKTPKDAAEEAEAVKPVKPAAAAGPAAAVEGAAAPVEPAKLRAQPAESVELSGEELEELKLPDEHVQPVPEKKGLFTTRNLLIAACIPLAALAVVLLIFVLKSGPGSGGKKTSGKKVAAAGGDSAGDASTETAAATDAAVEMPRAAPVDGSTAPADSAAAPADSAAEPDAETTTAASSPDASAAVATRPARATRPVEKPAVSRRVKPAKDGKVRVKLIIMPRDAVVVVIFRGKKYWGTKFVSPRLTPASTPETIRIRSRLYKDFNLTVTLDQNISRVISLQRKKKRMKLFDLKLKEKK
jgi:hypothetical protein